MKEEELRFEFKVSLKKVWYKKKLEKPPKPKKLALRNSPIMAYQMQDYIESGKIKVVRDFCKWIPVSHSRLCQINRLLLLAPDIQEDVMSNDDDKIAVLTEENIKKIPMQHDWGKQREMWRNIIIRASLNT